MSETKVVNIKTDQFDVKCCRTKDGKILPVPDPSCCGNPFVMRKESDREEVIRKFKEYFYERIKNEPDFVKYVKSLKGKRLACFCSPKACHVDIIKEYLDGLE